MINYLQQFGIPGIIIGIVIVIFCVSEFIKMITIIWNFFAPKFLGIQTKMTEEKKFRKQIIDNNDRISDFMENQDKFNDKIESSLDEINSKVDILSDDVTELKLEEMRAKILDFASAINEGRIYTREQYNYIRKLHDTYENFVITRNKTNDEVEISMGIINDSYEDKVRNKSFVEDLLMDTRIQRGLKRDITSGELDEEISQAIERSKRRTTSTKKQTSKSQSNKSSNQSSSKTSSNKSNRSKSKSSVKKQIEEDDTEDSVLDDEE